MRKAVIIIVIIIVLFDDCHHHRPPHPPHRLQMYSERLKTLEEVDNARGVDCERTSCLFPVQPHPPNNSERLSAVFYSVFILPVFHLFIVKRCHFLFRPDHTLSIACLDLVFIASQLDLTHIKARLAE